MLPKRVTMKVTCAELFGFIFIVKTNVALIISITTPYWTDGFISHKGLMAVCIKSCTWYYEHDFLIQKNLPDWFKATQGLMSVGLGLCLIALLVATLSLCCTCHSCNPNQAICGLLMIACISMAVGIVVFGVKAHDEWGIELEKGIHGNFGWSFWVGIGATALAFLTSGIYCCMGRKQQ